LFNLRINAGPSFSYLLSVGENDLDLTKDDYKDAVWGLQAGLGLDVLFLSFDIFMNSDLQITLSMKSLKILSPQKRIS
jgi:hypothetical protein